MPFMRVVTIAMGAVLCFGMLVPRALAQRQTLLATGVSIVFVAYVIVNVVLWRRMKSSG